MTRKEVRRIRDQLEPGRESVTVKSTPLGRILHKWYTEEDFLDSEGRPAVLPFLGDGQSFSMLVKRFGGDIPAGAMRTELKRIEAIEEDSDGNIKALRRYVLPTAEHEKLCRVLSHSAYPLLSNIAHNTNPAGSDNPWAHRTAYTAEIRESDIKRLRRICNDRSEEAVESFDDLFVAYENLNENDSDFEPTRPVAVGVFFFEELDEKMDSVWQT